MPSGSWIEKYKIDLDLSRQSIIGQPGITFDNGRPSEISRLLVSRYSRFGNNFYQVLHALLIASRLEISSIVFQGLDLVQDMPLNSEVGFEVDVSPSERSDNDLCGAFYAPYGFEALIQSFDSRAIVDLMKRCLPGLYRDVLGNAPARDSVVLHFRGGDIFTTHLHPWYVQPPASFYLKALYHAFEMDDYAFVQLVSEDRLNPVLDEVERCLDRKGIPFVTRINDLAADISILLSSKCIIASYGTFCEAAALISKNLKWYYAFRKHSSQSDLQPFLQSEVGPLLVRSRKRCFIIDDYAFGYIMPRTWHNSEEQRLQMRDFPSQELRIFEHLDFSGSWASG